MQHFDNAIMCKSAVAVNTFAVHHMDTKLFKVIADSFSFGEIIKCKKRFSLFSLSLSFSLKKFFIVHRGINSSSKLSTRQVMYNCICKCISIKGKKQRLLYVFIFPLFFSFLGFCSHRIAIACSQYSGEGNNFSAFFCWWLLALLIATIMLVVGSCRVSSHAFQSYNACQTNVKYYCSTSLWNRQIFHGAYDHHSFSIFV